LARQNWADPVPFARNVRTTSGHGLQEVLTMNKRQQVALERYRSIDSYVRITDFPGPRWKALQREFQDAFAGLQDLKLKQDVGALSRQMHAKGVAELRRKLRRGHMLPIRRDALLHLRKLPGVVPAVVVPHASASNAALVAAAKRMAKGLARYRKHLEAHDVPVGFLASLRGAARDLAEAVRNEPVVIGTRSAATSGLKEAFTRLRALEVAVEGQVMMAVGRDRSRWKLWLAAKRTPRRRGRPPKAQ
jgi:hypothetical protein